MSVYDTTDAAERADGIEAARAALADGKLAVIPTDTVYGIAADAFQPDAVQALLDAKERGRTMPPPVLIGDPAVLRALAVDLPDDAVALAEAFWPGPLTIICTAQPSLSWDLGETRGTVALRMPESEVAIELLKATGPLAVSSANKSGRPAAVKVVDAAAQLGESVEVYLDAGASEIGRPSTIVDTTVTPFAILRDGALSREDIVAAVGDVFSEPAPPEDETTDEAGTDEASTDGESAVETGTDGESSGETGTDSDAPVTTDAAADATVAHETEGDDTSAEASPAQPDRPETGPEAEVSSAQPDRPETDPGTGTPETDDGAENAGTR